jgi:hypothetical protein
MPLCRHSSERSKQRVEFILNAIGKFHAIFSDPAPDLEKVVLGLR